MPSNFNLAPISAEDASAEPFEEQLFTPDVVILMCGSRTWQNRRMVQSELKRLQVRYGLRLEVRHWDHQGENKPRHIALPVIEISKENPVQREYYRNHRTIGYKIGTCTINDEEYILLQTETRDPIACRVNELLPVNQGQRLFEAGVTFENAIKQARFLGISDEELLYIMKRELERD